MITLVQQWVDESARRFPDKVAVACRGESIPYGALDRTTNAFARHLAARGLGRGSFVPIFIPKSINAIKAILSVLKADCAYVPIDVTTPARRLADVLAATGARIVLTDRSSEAKLRALLPDASGSTITRPRRRPRPRRADRVPQPLHRCRLHAVHVRLDRHAQGRPDPPRHDPRLHRVVRRDVCILRQQRHLQSCAAVLSTTPPSISTPPSRPARRSIWYTRN